MVDKPKDRGEALLELLIAACRKLRNCAAQNPKYTKITAAACCIILAAFVLAGFAIPKQVTVYTDDSLNTVSEVYKTTARTVDGFLEKHEIDFKAGQDAIEPDLASSVTDGMEIHITRQITAEVTADGKTEQVKVLPATVAQVLQELDITLDHNDVVEPSLDTRLKTGDQVTVKRIVEMKETELMEEEFEVQYVADDTITMGDVQVTTEGRPGKIRKAYDVLYVDGVEVSRVLSGTEVLVEKQDEIRSYGTKIDMTVPEGLKYEKKYENVRAVSYYFSGTPHGAYGLPCEFGTVAVDKKLIPLGSLLYIEGYGYAIANDVGTSIKGKTVDLYMEKYEQCLLWGARWTTVYVIDEA